MLDSAAGVTVGQLVPDYELLKCIGRGAYGEVWLARSKATGVLRAAKIVRRRTFEDERPFQREFEGIRRFERISREHPSQLALFHIGRNEAEGFFYYVMELADNIGNGADYSPRTLRAELQQGRLRPKQVVEIGLALAEALGHLHREGLVHRDVKPSNVIFVNGKPKLADIGLLTDSSDNCSIVGTEGYLSPDGPGTPRGDIYALGKVLYESATGLDRLSFPDLPQDLKEWPDAMAVLEVNEIALKACARSSEQGYEDCDHIQQDLALLQRGKSVRRARGREYRFRLARRAAAWISLLGAVLGLLTIVTRFQKPASTQHEKFSTNDFANQQYRLGKANFDLFRGTNMANAAGYFTKATQADTNFAQAYGLLAATYFWGGFADWNPQWVFLPRAREAALRALALDDSLAEPHLALGWYYGLREWKWSQAEKEDQRAVALNSSSSFCHLCYGELLRVIGKTNEALVQIYQAKNLDPSSRIINVRLIDYLVCARQFPQALDQIDVAFTMEAVGDMSWDKRDVYLALGQTDDALEAEKKGRIANGEPAERVEAAILFKKRRVAAEGIKVFWLDRLEWDRAHSTLYVQACDYAQLGKTNEALGCLQQLLDDRSTDLTFQFVTDWRLDPIRSHPRFRGFIETMHLNDPSL